MAKYDVFISYSSLDQKVAEGVCGYLESHGCRCFVAYRDIPRGKVWARAIADAIDHSRIMVVVFSEHFNNSEQTDREIELAAENKMPILTFRIAESEFTGAKKYYLKNLNWIDAFPNPDACFGKLFESVSSLLNLPDDDSSKKSAVKKDNPAVPVSTSSNPNLKIKCDLDCGFYLDGEERLQLKADQLQKIPLPPGEYELVFVGMENPADRLVQDFEMPQVDKLLKVRLKEIRDKRLQKEAEEKRIAEEKRLAKEKRWEEEKRRVEEEEKRMMEVWRREEEERKRAKEEERRLATSDREFTVNGVSFKMIYVEGGTFQMGFEDHVKEDLVHSVTLSSYHIGETPVTRALWKAVMGNKPSFFRSLFKDVILPVEQVNWYDCQEFIKKLNQLTGKTFRLLTEAEWEYAARGGKHHSPCKYAGSDKIDDVAWYINNSGDKYLTDTDPDWIITKDMYPDCIRKDIIVKKNHCKAHPVKTKKPNALGIYDMSGNVCEWCQDLFENYSGSAHSAPEDSELRVKRGGSWACDASTCEVYCHMGATSNFRKFDHGFRLAL